MKVLRRMYKKGSPLAALGAPAAPARLPAGRREAGHTTTTFARAGSGGAAGKAAALRAKRAAAERGNGGGGDAALDIRDKLMISGEAALLVTRAHKASISLVVFFFGAC